MADDERLAACNIFACICLYFTFEFADVIVMVDFRV